jgi:hypothetical protein
VVLAGECAGTAAGGGSRVAPLPEDALRRRSGEDLGWRARRATRSREEEGQPATRWQEGAAVVHTPEEEREELDEELVEETMRWRGCARGWAWWSLSDACWERPIFCNRSGD